MKLIIIDGIEYDLVRKESSQEWEIVQYKYGEKVWPADALNWHELSIATIHSVKRLSDGVTFSVGDEVVHKTDGMINTSKILKFVIPETLKHLMWFEFMEGYDYCKDLANFDKLPPQPQKLSEDKSVCKSDSGHCVNSNVCQELDKCMYIDRAEKSKPQEQRIAGMVKDEYDAPPLYTQQQVDELCEKAATDFIHYTEFVMNDDSWLCEDGMKSMSDVYKEFVQWKNKKQ